MNRATINAKIAAAGFTIFSAVVFLSDDRQLSPEEQSQVEHRAMTLKAITACRDQILKQSHQTIETCADCYDVKEFDETVNIFVRTKSSSGAKVPALCVYHKHQQKITRFAWQ